MEVKSFYFIGDNLAIDMQNGERAILHKFGKTIYSTVTDNLLKKDLTDLKKSVIKHNWNIDKLEKEWITK